MAVPNRVVQAPNVNGSWAKPLDQHPPVPVTGGCYLGRCGSSRSRHRPGPDPMDTPATSREPGSCRPKPNPHGLQPHRVKAPGTGQPGGNQMPTPHHRHHWPLLLPYGAAPDPPSREPRSTPTDHTRSDSHQEDPHQRPQWTEPDDPPTHTSTMTQTRRHAHALVSTHEHEPPLRRHANFGAPTEHQAPTWWKITAHAGKESRPQPTFPLVTALIAWRARRDSNP